MRSWWPIRSFDGAKQQGAGDGVATVSYWALSRGEVVSIGIGDADNDRSLLEATDMALLVRSPVHDFPVLDRTDNTFHSRSYGPEGWVQGVEAILTTLLGKEALA